ncbi:integrase, catalytic region, zinc finger, CCHC-type containing protein [Tanacetum coccineum]
MTLHQLSFEETKLDGEAGFGDVARSGINSSGLSHDESFRVDDLDLNLNVTMDLNVLQTKQQAELLVSEEADVGRTQEQFVEHVMVKYYASSEKDAKHGNGQEVVEAPSDEQVDDDVEGIYSKYKTQYHVESSEDAESDVDVHLFGISMDVSFDNIGATNLVPNNVLEKEDVDVVNPDGFDSNTDNDNETSNYGGEEKIFDQVRVNPEIPVKVVQDQLQRELELQVSMSKAFKAKTKVKREIKGDQVWNGTGVAISIDPVRVMHERLSNIVYGFFLGKRAAYPVVENCVNNTWIKYGLVKSMMTTKGMIFFKFGSKDRMDAMIKNDPWLTLNISLILKMDTECEHYERGRV